MSNVTVLYITASAEEEEFEKNIIGHLLKNCGDLPIVSVSQKPLDLGNNICVGYHEPCYENEFRQMQIGLREVNTEYVVIAESDFIYPPEYFSFSPSGADVYRYGNVWVIFSHNKYKRYTNKGFFKGFSDGAQMIKRDFLLNLIDKHLGVEETWFTPKGERVLFGRIKTDLNNTWTSEEPAITFKTLNNVKSFTTIYPGSLPVDTIPNGGLVMDLIKNTYGK